MRIVITGALGHIGSRLIREAPFRFPGADIVMLNHYSSERYYPLFDLPTLARYHFHGVDVMEADLTKLFRGADAVIHLASVTRTRAGVPLGEDVEALNLQATERVAKACLKAEAPLVFLSTTSVYGTRAAQIDENCAPEELVPQSLYAKSKLREEALLRKMGQQDGLRFTIGRFGTIFGFSPGMRFDTAVNKFCWQANLGQPVTVWKTAMDQQRPYLDVADAVAALLLIVEKELFDGGIYNVLTVNTTVRHILDLIRREIPQLQVDLVRDSRMNELSFEVSNARICGRGLQLTGNLERGVREVLARLRGIRAATPNEMAARPSERAERLRRAG